MSVTANRLADSLGFQNSLFTASLEAYSNVMNSIAQEESTGSRGDQVEYVAPDRRTAIKYLLWVAIMIATPYLVTIGLISIVGFVGSLWLVLWLSIQVKGHEKLTGWSLVGFIAGGVLFTASGMLLVLDLMVRTG